MEPNPTFRFTLTHGSTVEILPEDPAGWGDMEILLERDRQYHGVYAEYTTKLSFRCPDQGYVFLKAAYDSDGYAAEVTLQIEIDPCITGEYEDFASYKVLMDTVRFVDDQVNVNMERPGDRQLIQSRWGMKTDLHDLSTLGGLPLTDYTYGPYDMTLHSKNIRATSEIGSLISDSQQQLNMPIQPRNVWWQVPYGLVDNELTETQTNPAYFMVENPASSFSSFSNLEFHSTANQIPILVPGTYTISWDFSGTYSDTAATNSSRSAGSVGLILVHGTRSNPTQINIGTMGGYVLPNGTGTHSVSFNFSSSTTVLMNPGDSIWLIWIVELYQVIGALPDDVTFEIDHTGVGDTAQLRLYIDSVLSPSTAKGFAIHEAFARLGSHLVDKTDVIRSTYFGRTNSSPFAYPSNGCGCYTAVSNGYQIRKFDLDDYPIQMSFGDLYDAMNSIHGLGWGTEFVDGVEYLRLERIGYFYNKTSILSFDNIDEWEITVDRESVYNEIDIGFNRWEVEKVNAIDEFATRRSYANTTTAIKNKLEARTDFVASGYAIETTRRLSDKPTTDSPYDKDNFIFCLNRSTNIGGVPTSLNIMEKDENLASITGVLSSSTLYNIRLLPSRNVLRWMPYISAGMRPAEPRWSFRFGEGNITVSSRFVNLGCPGDNSGFSLNETEDLIYTSGNLQDGELLWFPEIYEFEHPLSYTDYKTLRDNPYNALSISQSEADHIKVFILDVRYNPNLGKASFRCLRAAE